MVVTECSGQRGRPSRQKVGDAEYQERIETAGPRRISSRALAGNEGTAGGRALRMLEARRLKLRAFTKHCAQ